MALKSAVVLICVCVYVCVGEVKKCCNKAVKQEKQKIIRIAFVVNDHFLIVRTE